MTAWNGALRFGLEIASLVGLAGLGWSVGSGIVRVLAVVLPLAAATVWGRYRVPGDPGPAPVTISGRTRLGFELLVFAAGYAGLIIAFGSVPAYVFLGLLIIHHVAARDRIDWLLQR